MKKEFYIKNMVCDRCKMVVKQLAESFHANTEEIQLGKVVLNINQNFNQTEFAEALQKNGFKLMQNPEIQLTEEIKIELIHAIEKLHSIDNISTYLANKLHKDYSLLSKTFKKIEAQTIEKFFIKLKIEKVKEFIQMNKFSFSEIAYQLDYNSIHHLSNQFKTLTGMTMSEYKNSPNWNRIPLDKIV
ncbi:helix-turn-helix domain-containing protein [Mesonia aestuariivivens]|uniref:Helix-turn-helix domain-containing protein n=1 Tax=Mesonia aestuariivivens TaxID=2796128 RepID=A0ABS6VZT9_9FLAO|nr:helix-turn-helix domain-containing protein [Mesonia aestuariivivens]MBW2961120.1 helix-turn-helix domain-containing protein [Mesonia aestuariivivens]